VSIYEGQWEDGNPNGQGKKVYKNGKIETGKFRDGEYIPPYNAPSVKIGNQTWMTKNLQVTKFRNGDPIPEAKSAAEWASAYTNKQAAFCYYNNDPSTAAKFGILYNYYALIDSRGLAPEGWKLPNHNDANELRNYLNEELIAKQNKILEAKNQGISTDKMRAEYNKVFSSSQILLSADFKILPSYQKGAIHFIANSKFARRKGNGEFQLNPDQREYIYWTTSTLGEQGYVMNFSKFGLLNSYSSYNLERGWMSDHWLQADNFSEYKGEGLPVRLMKLDN
jgi:uncharacterized protein (TIGR02145 family)